jgi:hypothetical protein
MKRFQINILIGRKKNIFILNDSVSEETERLCGVIKQTF